MPNTVIEFEDMASVPMSWSTQSHRGAAASHEQLCGQDGELSEHGILHSKYQERRNRRTKIKKESIVMV